MQSESHFNTHIVRNSLLQTFVIFIFLKSLAPGYLGYHIYKSKNCKVRHLAHLHRRNKFDKSLFLCFSDLHIILTKLPHQKKSISYILVWTAQMLVHLFMTYRSYLVDKDHHICLEYFRSISEVSYIAKSKQSHYLLSRYHDVYNRRILNNLANNLCSCLSKTHSKETTNLHYCILQYPRLSILHLTFFLFNFLKTHVFLLYLTNSIQRIKSYLPHSIHHIFKRCNSRKFQIRREEYRCNNEQNTDKSRSSDIKIRSQLVIVTYVIPKSITISTA